MERDGLVLRLKPVNDQRKAVRLADACRNCAVRKRPRRRWKKTYRLLEAQFTTEKLQQLTSLLEEFIALGVPAGRGDEEE
ncbi:Homoprotocatechuate degradative operon repressor [Klebsiella pneumoniae]|uniref:Homoprotocatechuate degradative operon repressor n=1 Tax=Klebsiella pneumoniae TaxID=573 RepID=A0A3S4GJ03_KLEPN|nr:Homoprotocatechuate degradative operon repressor [Klebsiella pneumoniae]